jgi:hypothetical protein
MSHEIEAEFVSDWATEATQCQKCTSFEKHGDQGFCQEAKSYVPDTAHCDFFQSQD